MPKQIKIHKVKANKFQFELIVRVDKFVFDTEQEALDWAAGMGITSPQIIMTKKEDING